MPQRRRAVRHSHSACALASSPSFLAYSLLLVILAGLFGPSLVGSDRLAFRDCGHFYTPLYRYVAVQERAQWFPLFNPLDVAGMPLAGETTTALFYPVRRLVYLLVPSAEAALAWYVVLHLLLAGVTIHHAAAVAGARPAGRALAILAYPLSGPILFLYCNPPFLVGAAWIPLALAGGFRLLSRFRPRDLAITSVGLAMPILGGDPQVSIHVVIIGLAAALFDCLRGAAKQWTTRSRVPAAADKDEPDRGVQGNRTPSKRAGFLSSARGPRALLRLAVALLLAIGLASPQIAASIDWAKQSARYAPGGAVRAGEAYDFSVAPWHWFELVAPGLSGRLFPIYTRISHIIPDDGRTWAITLYAGLIPLALTVLRYRYTRWRRLDLWDYLAPIGLALALGSFGLGYLLKMLVPVAGLRVDDAIGGPYWWLATFLPGYAGFRYPAKWLIFVPLGIAIAASRQTDRWSPDRRRRLAQSGFALAMVTLSVSAVVVVALQITASRSPQLLDISDPFWGPLQWRAAASIVATSALAVVSIAAAMFWICHTRCSERWINASLLVLVAIDLAIVAGPLVATVDRAAESQRIATVRPGMASPSPGEPQIARRAMRFVHGAPWLSQWRSSPSPGAQRMLDVEASQRNSLYGRWHLMEDRAVFNPVTSLPPHRAGSFWQAANALARQTPTAQQPQYWDRIMGWLAIDQAWTVVSVQPDLSEQRRTDPPTGGLLSLRIDPTRSDSQPVRWSPSWRAIPGQNWVSGKTFAARLNEIASAAPHAPPLVEMSTPVEISPHDRDSHRSGDANSSQRSGQPSIVIVHASPSRWQITIDAPTSGLVCIKQFQDGNWRATTRKLSPTASPHVGVTARRAETVQPSELYRCDYLFSAVLVPAGATEITLTYQPGWFKTSLILAALAWLGWLTLWLLPLARGPLSTRRPTHAEPRNPSSQQPLAGDNC